MSDFGTKLKYLRDGIHQLCAADLLFLFRRNRRKSEPAPGAPNAIANLKSPTSSPELMAGSQTDVPGLHSVRKSAASALLNTGILVRNSDCNSTVR